MNQDTRAPTKISTGTAHGACASFTISRRSRLRRLALPMNYRPAERGPTACRGLALRVGHLQRAHLLAPVTGGPCLLDHVRVGLGARVAGVVAQHVDGERAS